MFHVKRCAFPAFPQQIIKSCDVIAPTFSFSTVPLRDPSTTSSEPSPPSPSLLRYLNRECSRVRCFTWNADPRPAPSRGEAIHFNRYLLRLNYSVVFHVKPLSHCAPTKLTFHVKHHTPLYDAHSNPPCFTWNMENLVQTPGKRNPAPRQLKHAPPILRNKLSGFKHAERR